MRLSFRDIVVVSYVLLGGHEFVEILACTYFMVEMAPHVPRNVRWVARWKNDIIKAWQDEDPDYFK